MKRRCAGGLGAKHEQRATLYMARPAPQGDCAHLADPGYALDRLLQTGADGIGHHISKRALGVHP